MAFRHRNDLIGRFAQHRVAANLLMTLMILAGVGGLFQLNTQFFPDFELDTISVRVVWSGATAEDVERSVTVPLEQELRTADYLRSMTSTSADGISSITLEYEEGAPMGEALDEVKERVDLVRNLPADAEEPEINRAIRYEPVAKLLVTSEDARPTALRELVYGFEQELLNAGIAKVDIDGLPDLEMAIQIPALTLEHLGLPLTEIAGRIESMSRDIPAGTVGEREVGRQLRSLDQARSEASFAEIPVVADDPGQYLRLGDIATINERPQEGQTAIRYRGQGAVEMQLRRTSTADSLKSAKILETWLAETRPTLPAGVKIEVYDETWRPIADRINLLIKNGLGGLLLVILILFLFLNGRVAFWVMVGIPVSFMATLFILYFAGGSINMISLFALIMALGIIVDDAIVVGEDAFTHFQQGESPLSAAEGGANRMLGPVMASSLTTVAAFAPLMLVGGPIGLIMFQLPLVIVCVVFASLIESFLVLPGHLRHAFNGLNREQARTGQRGSRVRRGLEQGFEQFRETRFRPFVARAVRHRWTTLSTVVAFLIVAIGLIAGGRLNFVFFPSPESDVVYADVAFTAGTPRTTTQQFMREVEQALQEAEAELGEPLVVTPVTRIGIGAPTGGPGSSGGNGNHFGSMVVELVDPDDRSVRNPELLETWRKHVELPPGIETFTLTARRAGPPGRDINVRLLGEDADDLKAAALELKESLQNRPGVSAVVDDMPYGEGQLIYTLTPRAKAAGLTVAELGDQIRAAYEGALAQIYQSGRDEVEVRVMLAEDERESLDSLDRLPIHLPNGNAAPLGNLVDYEYRRGFEALRHADGQLAVEVSGNLDSDVTSTNEITTALEKGVLAELQSRYGLEYTLEGRAADQRETLGDMRRGLVFALALIYLILAWIFSSYVWPLLVMSIIPFGIVGAVLGHWLMGVDLTLLSLFGLFGLTGILVNDSIILVIFYKHLREAGMATEEAVIEAACQRLRAVLLTSLTTIAGLTPLLFETSLQAQFLIPMAISISFGLGVATFLVLLIIPALLLSYEQRFGRPLEAEAQRHAAEVAGTA